ncbi:MAG: AhpC/TSA family protein [Caulobacterales bacterium]|nr:AhpC/TSA family protein [Caulobacterales bacterium]
MSNTSAFYDGLQDWIAASDVVERALKAGDPMPAFLAPSADGGLVSSAELLRGGPLVISFFRGAWCPFCVDELRALDAALPAFEARASRVVAISPEAAEPVRQLQGELSIPILSDLDYGIGLLFGVIFVVPPFMRAHLEAHGVDLGVLHGSTTWMLPIPATYVVDHQGRVAAAFVDADFTCRTDPGDILAALDALQG